MSGATAKRAYRITPRGRAALEEELARLDDILREAEAVVRAKPAPGRP